LRADVFVVLPACQNLKRRRSWAFNATMITEVLMAIAPTLMINAELLTFLKGASTAARHGGLKTLSLACGT
jgi:hypothetical protein